MRKYLFIVLLIGVCFGQVPDTLWTRTFGSSGEEIGRKVINTSDGGFAMVGYSNSNPQAGYVQKLNEQGLPEWDLYFNNIIDIQLVSIKQTEDQGYICAGYSSYYDWNSTFILLKINSEGQVDWSRTYEDFSINGMALDLIKTNDGGYAMTGYEYADDFETCKIKVIKTDTNGVPDWAYEYGNNAQAFGRSIEQNDQNEILVAGQNNNDGVILNLSQEGDLIWEKLYSVDSQETSDQLVFNNIKKDQNGGYILTGSIKIQSDENIVLLKIDVDGIEEWRKTYGEQNQDIGYSVELAEDYGYIIAGFKTNLSADIYILRVDEFGNERWNITLGEDSSLEPTNDKAYSIIKTPDNGYAIAGYTTSFGYGGFDYWLIRLGAEVLETIDSKVSPEIFNLHQNYPNPFNPTTSLRYNLPKDGLVNITIYDMMGRIVKTLVNGSQTAGYKSVQWNATNDRNEPVSAGLYLYTIQAGDFRQTKKMVLLK